MPGGLTDKTLPGPKGPRGGPRACAGSRLRRRARHAHVTRPAHRGSVPATLWRCPALRTRVQASVALETRSPMAPRSHSSSLAQSFASGDPRLLTHLSAAPSGAKEGSRLPYLDLEVL